MLDNPVKRKLQAGQAAFGYAAGLGSPLAVEVLSYSGIDFILLDTQHGSWGPESTIAALSAVTGSPAVPMARVARNDPTLIGRLLDEGGLGIVVPMVNTVDEARAAAAACRFPPEGQRSWGWGRARVYGPDYADQINDALFVAVQIESVKAVENAEAILSVPGIDGCWIGPSDLALSMGFHPRVMFERESHGMALQQVLQACHNTDTVPGIACASPA